MNFRTIIYLLSALPQILTLISSVVQNVEAVLGAAAPGSTKLAAATAQVNHILQKTVSDASVLTDLQKAVVPMIESSVAAFNAAGVFSHAPKAVEDPAPAPAAS